MSSDLLHHINSDLLSYINSNMINIHNLNLTSHKTDFHTDFSFCRDCLSFINVILAHFT